jgi:putative Holliday junction resolvase
MDRSGEPRAPGRVLGLDLGDARIGVAISDPDRRLAVPLGTVRAGRPPGELRAIADIVSENDVALVVVGLPLSLTGEAGPRARKTQELAAALASALPVPVELHDERLSTVEAERALRDAGATGRSVRRAVDRSAAAVILQSWLDARR